ncbi:MAG: M48 family metalloprotease [bacterium]|nr:M48 family metalloprotease [bacterium]
MANFQIKAFDHSVNQSPHRPFLSFVKLLGALIGSITIIYFVLGLFLERLIAHITVDQEMWFWNQLEDVMEIPYPQEEGDKKILAKQRYLRKIFDKIPKDRLIRNYPFKVYLSKDSDPNAYALPGGNIVVTEGLMDFLETENALTMILGHELGHLQNADHLRGLGRELVIANIVRFLLGEELSSAFVKISLVFDNQYSQAQESQADKWGVHLLNDTYKHVGGATEFFEKMNSLYGSGVLERFLSSHPPSQTRINRVQKIVKKEELEEKKTTPLKRKF